ncbi:MAG: hypothetical protein ACO4B3_14075, partial [Planctomycetota bacterium]
MSAPAPPEEPTSLPGEGPAGLEVLQAGGGHGRGNALLLDREGGALLKVYRSRRGASGAWRELLRDLAHRRLEGKRGGGPEGRRETEREVLRLGRSEGFDVPAVLDLATPPGIEEPSLWLEYCDGRTLDRAIADCALEGRGAPADRADLLVARLAGEHGRRHRRALDRTEPLLVQEHPTIVHTLHCGDRLVTIDFENAWASGAPVPLVVARELAGTLRSFFRRLGRGAGAGGHARALAQGWATGGWCRTAAALTLAALGTTDQLGLVTPSGTHRCRSARALRLSHRALRRRRRPGGCG